MRIGLRYEEREGVGLMRVPAFEELGGVDCAITTRVGGVSAGECRWLNMSCKRADPLETVEENIRRVCRAMGVERERMIFTPQNHGIRMRFATEADAGLGMTRPMEEPLDALLTDVPGLVLTKHVADCVPVLLYAPGRACAAIHAGWRGTAAGIAGLAVRAMCGRYGLSPAQIYGAVGPSIGPCCFEVGPEVAEAFPNHVVEGMGKPHVNLWRANADQLRAAGVPENQITVAEVCTCCQENLFYSHRRDHGRTGSMAALIALR